MYLQWIKKRLSMKTKIVSGSYKFSQRCSRWQENHGVLKTLKRQATFCPMHFMLMLGQHHWLNLSFPWLGDLPRFSWEEKVGHDIIGQGTFGPFLLSTAEDFAETVIKEAKIIRELQHNNIVSFNAICKAPMAMMSDFPF